MLGRRIKAAWGMVWDALGRSNNTKDQQGDESDKSNGKLGEHVLLQLLVLSRLFIRKVADNQSPRHCFTQLMVVTRQRMIS